MIISAVLLYANLIAFIYDNEIMLMTISDVTYYILLQLMFFKRNILNNL